MGIDTDVDTGNDFSFLSTDPIPDWLDGIDDSQAFAWTRAQLGVTVADVDPLAGDISDRTSLEQCILVALNTSTRITHPVRCDEYLYNFWRDTEQPRGL